MGFDDGPDPLPLGFFEPFRGEAQPGGKPLFAPDPLSQIVVGFYLSRLNINRAAVQQTGRLMASSWSNDTRTPDRGAGGGRLTDVAPILGVGRHRNRTPIMKHVKTVMYFTSDNGNYVSGAASVPVMRINRPIRTPGRSSIGYAPIASATASIVLGGMALQPVVHEEERRFLPFPRPLHDLQHPRPGPLVQLPDLDGVAEPLGQRREEGPEPRHEVTPASTRTGVSRHPRPILR